AANRSDWHPADMRSLLVREYLRAVGVQINPDVRRFLERFGGKLREVRWQAEAPEFVLGHVLRFQARNHLLIPMRQGFGGFIVVTPGFAINMGTAIERVHLLPCHRPAAMRHM